MYVRNNGIDLLMYSGTALKDTNTSIVRPFGPTDAFLPLKEKC